MFDYTQNPMYNPMINPYLAQQQPQQPRREVVKVNGENGARAFPMGANSSALLLDENGVLVWLVTTSRPRPDQTDRVTAPQPQQSAGSSAADDAAAQSGNDAGAGLYQDAWK